MLFTEMSSVLRYVKEPTPVSKRFTVFPYYGAPITNQSEYYFTVQNESLYRIEADLSGENQWVVARDIGKEEKIKSIDTEILEFWESNNGWSNIQVIREGRARKFQALAIPRGNIGAAESSGPEWNSSAYTLSNGGFNVPYYNNQLTGINDLLIMGNSTTTTGEYTQSLPFATFYAVIDPVVIRYDVETEGIQTYTRAIVNRVTPC
jgi:hypothetical protein